MFLIAFYTVSYVMMSTFGLYYVGFGKDNWFTISPGDLILFPLLYIMSDLFSEIFGYRTSRLSCTIAMVCSWLFAGLAALAIQLPAVEESQEIAGAFAMVYGPMVYFTLIGPIIFYIGDWVNDIIVQKWRRHLSTTKGAAYVTPSEKVFGLHYIVRSITSSLAGRLVDIVLASIFIGGYIVLQGWGTVRDVVVTAVWVLVTELVYETALAPIAMLIIKKVYNMSLMEPEVRR